LYSHSSTDTFTLYNQHLPVIFSYISIEGAAHLSYCPGTVFKASPKSAMISLMLSIPTETYSCISYGG
jgi:hypothetical protein